MPYMALTSRRLALSKLIEKTMGRITVNSHIIAESIRDQVWLNPILGSYELCFNSSLQGSAVPSSEKQRWATLNSARVYVKSSNSPEYDLGIAALEAPVSVKTHPEHRISAQVTYYLPLSSAQISKIEEVRDGKDLEFKLVIRGEGGDNEYTNHIHDDWRINIPRSEWISKLRQSGFADILLLEVLIPLKELLGENYIDIKKHLEEAQGFFMNGNYRSCIALCRDVIQEIGHAKFGDKNWHNNSLSLLAESPRGNAQKSRNDMNKAERDAAIWAALKHYTHLSHHAPSEGGEVLYTRTEAKLIITLTAAFLMP